ncbi:Oxoglutarate dehydrogenase (succinyl-transferring), partial [Scytalidium lignicola]
MFATRALRQAAHAERTPMIKFLGKRQLPSSVDHTPHPHPASPTHQVPKDFQQSSSTSFSSYRQQAQQHGPLARSVARSNAGIGAASGHLLGPVDPSKGVYFDRNELPARFRRTPLEMAEIDAIETGGATLVC